MLAIAVVGGTLAYFADTDADGWNEGTTPVEALNQAFGDVTSANVATWLAETAALAE